MKLARKSRPTFSGRRRFVLAVVAVSAFAGCDGGTGIVPVSGTVTFDGETPPAGGTVWFTAVEAAEGFPMRPGTGDFGPDGKFRVKSYEPGDGLMPGKYKVYLMCWERPPEMGGPPPISYLPAKYQNASTAEIEFEIPVGSKALTFDVNVDTSAE